MRYLSYLPFIFWSRASVTLGKERWVLPSKAFRAILFAPRSIFPSSVNDHDDLTKVVSHSLVQSPGYSGRKALDTFDESSKSSGLPAARVPSVLDILSWTLSTRITSALTSLLTTLGSLVLQPHFCRGPEPARCRYTASDRNALFSKFSRYMPQ